MIFELIVIALAAIFGFLAVLFPDVEMPGWVSDFAGLVDSVSSYMAPLETWLPFGALETGVAFVSICLLVALLIRIIRIAASFLTLGGGSAA